MLIDFNEIPEVTLPGMNKGTGEMSSRMFVMDEGKAILCRIHPGGSIGNHRHDGGMDMNYVLSGEGMASCDGRYEILRPGCMHVCPKGSEHSIKNTGRDDLVLLTITVNV